MNFTLQVRSACVHAQLKNKTIGRAMRVEYRIETEKKERNFFNFFDQNESGKQSATHCISQSFDEECIRGWLLIDCMTRSATCTSVDVVDCSTRRYCRRDTF